MDNILRANLPCAPLGSDLPPHNTESISDQKGRFDQSLRVALNKSNLGPSRIRAHKNSPTTRHPPDVPRGRTASVQSRTEMCSKVSENSGRMAEPNRRAQRA